METINNMANAAAKAVWGEGQTNRELEGQANREPISGAQGNVAQGEPYDAGNLETPHQERLENNQGIISENKPTAKPLESQPASASRTENAAYASTDHATEQENIEEKRLNEADLQGSGPRPLEVVAKENGGDASLKSGSSSNKNSREENTLDTALSGENLTEAGSKGTGEEYVRASGLAADGGDFDATKPGAGREADRLLEEKGVHRDEATGSGGHKDKPSLGERIKAKFHKH